jgi:hypothetical protein
LRLANKIASLEGFLALCHRQPTSSSPDRAIATASVDATAGETGNRATDVSKGRCPIFGQDEERNS